MRPQACSAATQSIRVQVQSELGLRDLALTRFRPDCPVLSNPFLVAVTARVVQMQHAGGVAHHDGLDAGVHQTLTELTILAAIAHALVKAANLDGQFAPG